MSKMLNESWLIFSDKRNGLPLVGREQVGARQHAPPVLLVHVIQESRIDFYEFLELKVTS